MKHEHYYLEIQKGDKVLARKATTKATSDYDWTNLDNKIEDRELEVNLIISTEKEKVFNYLDY